MPLGVWDFLSPQILGDPFTLDVAAGVVASSPLILMFQSTFEAGSLWVL